MKKVAIITVLDNTNYGTYLQALALGLVIKNLGYKVEIIDYVRSFMTKKSILSRSKNPIKRIYNTLFNIPQQEKLKKKDKAFLQHFLTLTPQTYISFQALKDNPPIADIYVTGSDQVWNSTYNRGIDKSFFLDFVPSNSKRISYAASIGMKDFPKEEKNEVYNLLKQYSHITVRENDAKNILKQVFKMGYTQLESMENSNKMYQDEIRNEINRKKLKRELNNAIDSLRLNDNDK